MGNIRGVEEYLRKDFGKILKSAGLESRRWMKATDSSTSRVYDRNLEELPVTVDLYGDWARIVDYSEDGLDEEEKDETIDIVSRFLYVEKNKIVYSFRKKREGHEQHEKGDEECQVTVRENGLIFECELKKYADTGLFLDQEETRKLIREMARNQRVLNLFCYTSSFSVYAADGNAESVVSVDLSNVYSAWSRRNLENNGFLDEGKYEVVTEDCRTYLIRAKEEKKVFDLVILDPPAFSNSHKAETFDVQRDYLMFLSCIYDILSDGGVVLFSENLQGFRFEKDKLSSMYEAEEITQSVFAPNFSHKRKSCRVWLLKRNSERKRERKERKMSEELERFDVNLEKKTEKKREKKEARAFTFDDTNESGRDFSSRSAGKNERRESRYSDRDDRRSYSRDNRSSRYNGRDDRRDYHQNRYSDRRDWNDDRRDNRYSDRRDSHYNNDRPSRYNDRRESRYGERNDNRRDWNDRRDDRRDYRDDRRDNRYSDRNSYSRDNRYGERREYSKSNERTSFARRDYDGSRSSYKRSSYSSDRDRNYRDDRRSGEKRKKSGPKPFGYDSFMENKSRQGATARWLEDQEYIEKKED